MRLCSRDTVMVQLLLLIRPRWITQTTEPCHTTPRELPVSCCCHHRLAYTPVDRREEKKESMEPTDISFLQGFQTQDRALSELEERVRMLQEVVKDQVRKGG